MNGRLFALASLAVLVASCATYKGDGQNLEAADPPRYAEPGAYGEPPRYTVPPPQSQPPSSYSGSAVLDDARQFTLWRINGFRAQAGRAPLRLDEGINAFSQAASVELSQDHRPHHFFENNWSSCPCKVNAENQGDWNGVPPAPVHDQIDEMLNLMMSEGPGGGHYENMLSRKWTRVGVGIVNPGGLMYFTNDFGP